MATSPHILTKIKFLINLKQSSNPHESQSAGALADKLINKYNVSQAELESLEDKPLYGDEEKLYHTFNIIGWQNQIALAIAKHFDCYIVQETIVSALGMTEYNYYVYGGEDETNYVKFVYHTFHKKVYHLIDTKCLGRGDIYIDSYAEGVAQGIKENIMWEGLEIPATKVVVRKPTEKTIATNDGYNLTKHTEKKTKPTETSEDVNKHTLIKDVNAYFRGIEDGGRLSLNEVLELEVENEEPEVLTE